MKSIFDVEEIPYDKVFVRKIVFVLNKSNESVRLKQISTLNKIIRTKEKIYRKQTKGKRKAEIKIDLKRKRKQLRFLMDVHHMKKQKEDEYRLLLFKMMKKLIVKNIFNYQKLAKNSAVTDQCFNKVEMESEAYIVLDRCIRNFDWKKKTNDFYYYYNSSLSRSFYRMFDKEVRKKDKYDDYKKHVKYTKKNESVSVDSDVEFVINQLGLTEIERELLNSKLIGEKKDEFLAKHPNLTSSKYYSILKKIKELIIKMQDNGEF